jgi:transmembrane sensor
VTALRELQDQAAQWIIAREEADWDSVRETELAAWLDQSDLHRVAFLRLERSWQEVDRLGSMGLSLEPELPIAEPYAPSRYEGTPKWIPAAVAAMFLMLLAGTWLFIVPQERMGRPDEVEIARIEAPVGSRKLVNLPDGSRIEVNTASVLRAAVGERQREIWLDQGEAYFDVAKDPKHPFIVHAGRRKITVLGTKFSVRRDGDKVTVAVSEGRVRVDDIEQDRVLRSTTINGGDIALGKGQATMVQGDADKRVADAHAWRGGMLNFDQKRLADVAAEFNRYNRRSLVVTDNVAGEIRIGGVYPADKPDEFARLLRDAYGLKIEEGPDSIKISY